MWGAIKHALANIANPNGRDGRSAFWYWMLAVFLLRFVVETAVTVPMTMRIVATSLKLASAEGTYNAAAQQEQMFQAVIREVPGLMWTGIGLGVVSIVLVGASLIRRLHDSGTSGWFALIPAGLYVGALTRVPVQIEAMKNAVRTMDPSNPVTGANLMQEQGPLAFLSWGAILMVIWIGLRRTENHPNRFGDRPVQF